MPQIIATDNIFSSIISAMPIATETSAGGWSSSFCHTKMADNFLFRCSKMCFVIQIERRHPKLRLRLANAGAWFIHWMTIHDIYHPTTRITDSSVCLSPKIWIFGLVALESSCTGLVPQANSQKLSSWGLEVPWLIDHNVKYSFYRKRGEQVAKWAFSIGVEIPMMLPQSWTWSSQCLPSDPDLYPAPIISSGRYDHLNTADTRHWSEAGIQNSFP